MSKTSRVAELALRLVSNGRWECLPLVKSVATIAADAAALVRLADTVTACDVVECNGGAVEGDDSHARRQVLGSGEHKLAWECVGNMRAARTLSADKRRTRALATAAKLARVYGLSVFHQPDPRGASLYLYDSAKHGEPHAGWDQHAPGVVCV